MAGITVKIGGVDKTEYVDARTLSIRDELTSQVNSASFVFICNDISLAPIAGQAVLIEEGTIKLFSGRILTKEEDFLPPNLLKYQIECIDNTRDLDKKLVIESYLDQKAGDIIKDVITKYTSGFTTVHVSDGPTITRIAFDYVQVSEAVTRIAETCGYEWYVDYDKDIYFFLKTDYPASFQLDDNQKYYKDLIINTDISQLRNRVYVKSEKYETLDFTELFVGDGSTVTWTCKYQANATPGPSATLNGIVKTVGWDGVDDPALFYFMLNATTKILSLGTTTPTPADGDEIVITYGADVAIIIRWDDEDSINAIKAIEGGDGIFEFCITNNNIDTKEWAIDAAKADLLQNANPVIEGNFVTNQSDVRSGQIITLNSTKRNINQDFLIQRVELVRVDVSTEYPHIPYKPAATAIIGYKPATAEEEYRSAVTGEVIHYVYQVTIATKLKGLEDLLLQLLYQSSESLKRDTEAPAVPSGLALSTGMGSITQASLASLKATWDTNNEDDFSHYELKYKKTAYSDFGLVTTTNTSFIWTGLEQNIEYEVYIRAVDIYGNRSNWSSQQTQVTATDSETPAQVTGAVATALLSGIKVTWNRSSESNIAGYAVERQESDDGTTWTGVWTERVRTDATMWLDLLLTYTKYYRYRIKAFTQTGTEGATSTPTADSISPNQAGTNDIVANAITADLIAANSIYTNALQAGCITTSKLKAGEISIATIGSDYNWSSLPDDGNKPANNADVTAASNFVTVTYPADKSDLQNQIDGKIVSWFTDTDPANSWSGTNASHAGDMWWNTSTKKLKRYSGTAWSAEIEDQKALDAYSNAATAQDTADGKRRVFTAEPTTPYDVGDLWSAGPSGDLKKCKTARASGAYVAGDWELASKYDLTSESNFVTVTYPADKSDLQNQIDGKIISWFQETDPNTWEEADRPNHDGDMW